MSDSLTAGELKEVTEEITIDVLHEVQKWLSGEQSKEKLAERLELDFNTLNTFLPSDSIPERVKQASLGMAAAGIKAVRAAIRDAVKELIEEIENSYSQTSWEDNGQIQGRWIPEDKWQQLKQKRGK